MSNQNRRTVFTSEPNLAIRRAPAATMAADGAGSKADQEPQVTLEGYAIVWNALSSDRGGFRVKFLPGSARFADNVHALFHHDYRAILGASGNGTLRLKADDVGVKVEIDLPDTQCARDVAELVDAKYIKGMSFSMLWDGIEYDVKNADTADEVMEVRSFLCDEVTVTAIPSFTDTRIGIANGEQDDADDDEPSEPPEPKAEPAYARIEQTIHLEQLRLANLEL